MAPLPHYLVPMVASYLTDTETRFWSTRTPPTLNRHIQWGDLFMSESLCRYGLQHYTKIWSSVFLEAMVTTAPYEVLVLPDITTLLFQDTRDPDYIMSCIITAHRPICILAYMFQLYNCSCCDRCADDFCDDAVASNNTLALDWLRDPTTGDGMYPLSQEACATAAAYGRIDMLKRLRDPHIDGGAWPWDTHVCRGATRAGQLETLIWLRDPKTGGGVCPWDKEKCLRVARNRNYSAIAAWIMAQPDDE
jgi:hypothetical protein